MNAFLCDWTDLAQRRRHRLPVASAVSACKCSIGSTATATHDRGAGIMQGVHPRVFVAKGSRPVSAPASPARAFRRRCRSSRRRTRQASTAARPSCSKRALKISMTKPTMPPTTCGSPTPRCSAQGRGPRVYLGGSRTDRRRRWRFSGVGRGTPRQFDHPPLRDAPGYFGAIVHPAGVAPPQGEQTSHEFTWQFPLSDEAALQTVSAGGNTRCGSIASVRTLGSPGVVAGDRRTHRILGPLGPRVARDPKTRRAGMTFPEFWEMFMSAFAKFKS